MMAALSAKESPDAGINSGEAPPQQTEEPVDVVAETPEQAAARIRDASGRFAKGEPAIVPDAATTVTAEAKPRPPRPRS